MYRKTDMREIGEGVTRFAIGLAKKALLANVCGELADSLLLLKSGTLSAAAIEASDGAALWMSMICYTLQIYLDFSAYSDMAIGMGRMIGLHYKENFNYPYTARTVKDFWRRWHISLSSFFRDYVYIPLGGAGANMLVQLDEAVTVNSLTIGTGEGEGTAELSLTGNNKVLTVKGDLVIKNKGKLSSESNGYYSSQNRKMRSYTGGYKVDAVVGGNITIDEGGSVDVSGKGYVHGRGFKSAYTSSGTYDNGEINGSHAGNSSGAGTSTTATPQPKIPTSATGR